MKRPVRLAAAALAAAFLIPTLPASATPPPPPRDGTDCNARVYAIDDQVCASDDLMRLDGEARTQNLMLLPDLRPIPASMVEAQADWYYRRSQCFKADKPTRCLYAAYNDRLGTLDILTHPNAAGTGEAVTCEGAPWGAGRVYLNRRADREATVLLDPDGHVMAVGHKANADGWVSTVTVVSDAAPHRFRMFTGAEFVCRPA